MTESSGADQPAGSQPNPDRVDWERLARNIRRILTEGPNEEDWAVTREIESRYPIQSQAATDGPHSLILLDTELVTPRKPAASEKPPRSTRGARKSEDPPGD